MKRKIVIVIIGLLVVAIGLWIGLSHTKESPNLTPYEVLKKNGYTGTEEQLIASLIGELSPAEGETETAFDRAKLLGYKGNRSDWIKVLTGPQTVDAEKAVYELVCESGYADGLERWLEGLVKHPEQLGEQVTEYNLACGNGFEGSFIQWLISLIGYQEN